MLRIAADIDDRTFDSAERVLELRPNIAVMAIYIGGFDTVAHAFWQYRFPEDFGDARPAEGDVARLGPVLDRYMRFVDARLGRLVGMYGQASNTMLISDHGHGGATTSSLWRGWHADRGVFLAAGPDIPQNPDAVSVSYFDVVPTILDLMACQSPSGLTGASLLRHATSVRRQ
jgi:predicted AlkP superfamily phosphohydrolase/phosphomutase